MSHNSNDNKEGVNWTVGIFLAISGTFLFALKSIFIKLCYQQGASTESILLLRMLLASPFYLGVLIYLKQTKKLLALPRGTKLLKIMGTGFLGYYLASYLDLAGLQYISAQLERMTLFTYPTMIAILAWVFLGERLTKTIFVSLFLSYLGLWIMIGQEAEISSSVTKGVFLVLGSALSYSVYVILAKPQIKIHSSLVFTSIAMLGSTVFVLIHASIQLPSDLFQLSSSIWIYSALLAILCTVLPSYMIAESIHRIGATKTTILGSLGPVFTILLAVLWINEPFSWTHAIGVAFVILGVSLITKRS